MDIFSLLWEVLELKQIIKGHYSRKLEAISSFRTLYTIDKKLKNTTKNAKSPLGLFQKNLEKV
jgi:hypothetical protein